jgi:hypothetical protein
MPARLVFVAAVDDSVLVRDTNRKCRYSVNLRDTEKAH